MSTKLFHGWRLDENIGMRTLLLRLKKFRDRVRVIAKRLVTKRTVRLCEGIIDTVAMSGKRIVDTEKENPYLPNSTRSLWSRVVFLVDDRMAESYKTDRRTGFDFQCSVTVHPVLHKGKTIFLMLFFDHIHEDDYRKAFERIVKAHPWPYWNNTDQPDGVTNAEWRFTERLWDRALGDGVPAENGFAFDCITQYARSRAKLDDAVKALRPISDRREMIAAEFAIDRRMRALERKKDKNSKDGFGLYSEARRWLKIPAGQRALKKARERAKKRLGRITKATLQLSVTHYYRRK